MVFLCEFSFYCNVCSSGLWLLSRPYYTLTRVFGALMMNELFWIEMNEFLNPNYLFAISDVPRAQYLRSLTHYW